MTNLIYLEGCVQVMISIIALLPGLLHAELRQIIICREGAIIRIPVISVHAAGSCICSLMYCMILDKLMASLPAILLQTAEINGHGVQTVRQG